MELRFAQSARRHRVGRAHVVWVIEHHRPTLVSTSRGEVALRWWAPDDTGRRLEVVVVILEPGADPLDPRRGLCIHVMPDYTHQRGES